MTRKKRTREEMEEYRRHYSEREFWRELGAMPRTAGLATVEAAVRGSACLTNKWLRTLVLPRETNSLYDAIVRRARELADEPGSPGGEGGGHESDDTHHP